MPTHLSMDLKLVAEKHRTFGGMHLSEKHQMRGGSLLPSGRKSRVTWLVWGLASVLFFFMAENIWIDPWLRSKSHRIPSLVPEALSGTWFLAFAIGGITLTLLVVWQILLMRNPILPNWTKIGTGAAMLAVLLLSVEWCRVTMGLPALFRLQALRKKHTVKLTWKASISKAAGYNVYRSTTRGDNYVRISTSLVPGLTYTDDTVESGVTYCYVARVVDARGYESINSNEVCAAIPFLW